MTIYIGTDPGFSGGLVAIDKNEKILSSCIMPVFKSKGKTEYNMGEIIQWFKSVKKIDNDMIVFLEKQYVRPMNGIRAAFMLGFGYGMLQGIIHSLKIPYEIVSPNEWMKFIFKGLKKDDKKASVLWCLRKYPDYDFRPTKRCTKVSDGLTDATAIAVYGVRNIGRTNTKG